MQNFSLSRLRMGRWAILQNLVVCAGFCLGVNSSLGNEKLLPGDHSKSLISDELERTYFVHVPASYDGTKPYPVVLIYHGGGSNASQIITLSGLNEVADEKGFIAVYPNGVGKKIETYEIYGWNGGPRQPGGETTVDDVAFTAAVLDELEEALNVDTKRVYATGLSMGAIMVYRLANELSERIAAIAPIAAPMGTEECNPEHPVSVMQFHGTADPGVPFDGGKGELDTSGADFLSINHSIQSWVKANACDETPVVEELPDTADDGTKAIRHTYGNGMNGSEVVLIRIEGGGHTWPGKSFGPELAMLGKSSQDISANELMWEFFEKHSLANRTE